LVFIPPLRNNENTHTHTHTIITKHTHTQTHTQQLRVHANPAALAAPTSTTTITQEEEEEEEEEIEATATTPLHDPATTGARALQMVLGTLTGMAKGSIRDWVGGGFHRYSTDPDWLVPHFEKMMVRKES
jgi:uncharacterized protein YyaL (SSP411 family)